MAFQAEWFVQGAKDLASAKVDWLNGTIRCAQVDNSYVPDQDNDHFWSTPQAAEVAGTGYTVGGIVLSSKTITSDAATNEVRLDAADISWLTASFTARYAVIFLQVGADLSTPGDDILLGLVDYGGDETVASGIFAITWDASGVLKAVVA